MIMFYEINTLQMRDREITQDLSKLTTKDLPYQDSLLAVNIATTAYIPFRRMSDRMENLLKS